MSQLPLFSLATEADIAPAAGASRPDPDSERLLAAFSDARVAQGAHPQSVSNAERAQRDAATSMRRPNRNGRRRSLTKYERRLLDRETGGSAHEGTAAAAHPRQAT